MKAGLLIPLAVAGLAVSLWAKKPEPAAPPITEKSLIGTWHIASNLGFENITFALDHTFSSEIVGIAQGKKTGTWRVENGKLFKKWTGGEMMFLEERKLADGSESSEELAAMEDDMLTTVLPSGSSRFYEPGPMPDPETANQDLPPGIFISGPGRRHADLSKVRLEDFPALAKLQKLREVTFKGEEVTDEKLAALTLLQLPKLNCVVFTDCPRVTDAGIEALTKFPTLTCLGLRQMSITDAACEVMAMKMSPVDVNLQHCPKVTAKGVLRIVQLPTLKSLNFSVGAMQSEDVLRIISTAGPIVERIEIEMSKSEESRLDVPALRQAGKDNGITYLLGVRENSVSDL